MKIVRLLDQEETKAVSDLLNQTILRELVGSELSISSLAKRLEVPVLKVWRRVQRLESLRLVEVSRTRKSGNIETKLYRASAVRFVPNDFLSFKPRDPRLLEAFAIFSEFQGEYTRLVSELNEIPEGWDPVDYLFYASMRAFAEAHGQPQAWKKVSTLAQKLSEFQAGSVQRPSTVSAPRSGRPPSIES